MKNAVLHHLFEHRKSSRYNSLTEVLRKGLKKLTEKQAKFNE